MNEIEDIRARRAAITTANRRVQRYPHLGLDPDTKQPIGERWTVVYAVNDPIWREPHLYIDGLAASRADATFDAAAPADIDALLAEIDRLRAALKPLAKFDTDDVDWEAGINHGAMPDDQYVIHHPRGSLTAGDVRQARAALGLDCCWD